MDCHPYLAKRREHLQEGLQTTDLMAWSSPGRTVFVGMLRDAGDACSQLGEDSIPEAVFKQAGDMRDGSRRWYKTKKNRASKVSVKGNAINKCWEHI